MLMFRKLEMEQFLCNGLMDVYRDPHEVVTWSGERALKLESEPQQRTETLLASGRLSGPPQPPTIAPTITSEAARAPTSTPKKHDNIIISRNRYHHVVRRLLNPRPIVGHNI